MKKIQLMKLTLRNFKKIQSLQIDFSDQTTISGDNGIGKTTVFDAYSWLLYGKNSLNQTDFDIKTLDENNNAIPKLEHEVMGKFDVDGTHIVFKRTYVEKWTTRRGNDFEELTGHETKYFVDDVPMSKSEYEMKIQSIAKESLLKMISNPDYFNVQLGWEERRSILETMSGEVTNEDVLNSNKNLTDVVALLEAGKTIEGEKARISAQKKILKEELKGVPSRIDEVDRAQPTGIDFEALEVVIQTSTTEIKQIESELADVNIGLDKQREGITKAKNDKFEKEQRYYELERTLKASANTVDGAKKDAVLSARIELDKRKSERSILVSDIAKFEIQLEGLGKERATLIDEWKSLQELTAPVVTDEDTCCPTCKRELDNAEDVKATLVANFNTTKLNKTAINERDGNRLKDRINDVIEKKQASETELIQINTLIEACEKKVAQIEPDAPQEPLKPTPEMIALKKEIESIVIPTLIAPDTSSLTTAKTELQLKIDTANRELAKKDQVATAKNRIVELQNRQRELAGLIAELDRIEFQIDSFNKAKAMLIESRVNSKFKLVKFKMFKEQLNGGEAPTCECMVNGVPYASLNTAGQINAGLDVINGLQNHFEIFAPVFVDHRESVFELQEMNCQLINLKAVEGQKDLLIESELNVSAHDILTNKF